MESRHLVPLESAHLPPHCLLQETAEGRGLTLGRACEQVRAGPEVNMNKVHRGFDQDYGGRVPVGNHTLLPLCSKETHGHAFKNEFCSRLESRRDVLFPTMAMSHDPNLKDWIGVHTGTPYVQLIALPDRSSIALTFRARVLGYS